MSTSKLAIFGGRPEISAPLVPYRSIGIEEQVAVAEVMRTGNLSGYVGAWCPQFDGGPVVQEFERAWAGAFGSRHAIAVNSNTSGLIAAMGAVGVGPGDEVIVPPYTMSATVMAPLIYGGIPVFVDIEPSTFCLDVKKVAAAIGSRTRAILAVNIFGHPAELARLRALADSRGVALVEDAAQSPLAHENGRMSGTIGHIGVFSLNYHKHIHTGEGGVCVTDDDRLALRLRAIRNHGENIVEPLAIDDISNLVGFNFRLTELGAAIGIEQLKKAPNLVAVRESIANEITDMVAGMDGITAPAVRAGCRHVYYVWTARIDAAKLGVSRAAFARALEAEGVPISLGYVAPLYRLPAFRRRIGIGREGWPFSLSNRNYEGALCPVAEQMYEHEVLEVHVCSYQLDRPELDGVKRAFAKVYDARRELSALD